MIERRLPSESVSEDWEDWYVVKENPMPWEIGPLGVGRAGTKIRPYVGPNLQLQAYQKAVRQALRDQSPIKRDGEVEVKFYIWRRIEQYETKKGRKASSHTADATNIQKATEDAIQGILIGNDRYVLAPSSVIMSQDKDIDGLVVIRVRPAQDHESEIPTHVWDKIQEAAPLADGTIESREYIDPSTVF